MDSTKTCYVGQTVAVAIINEQNAIAFGGIVLDIAATGASALVAQDIACQRFMDQHGARYLEAIREHDETCKDGDEVGIRIKAENIHPFSKAASQLIAKFKDIAEQRTALTSKLDEVVVQIEAEAKKAIEAKAEEMKKQGRVPEEAKKPAAAKAAKGEKVTAK